MVRYEYKCVFIWGGGAQTQAILNEYGRDGWDLAAVNWFWFYFKRPLNQD